MTHKINKIKLKNFGLIWTFICLIGGISPLFSVKEANYWFIGIAVILILISSTKLEILTPFYNLWIRLGNFIGGITSKVILFILFFGLFTPISFLLKLFKKDLLQKKINRKNTSYWIERAKQPESMKRQF